MLDEAGNPVYDGYCIELLDTLAEKMEFNYDLVFPKDGAYGAKDVETNRWNGVVGDLVAKVRSALYQGYGDWDHPYVV